MYTPVAQRSRAAAFDTLQQKGSRMLGDPRVLRSLGRLGSDILTAWEGAFLPNVQHGVVSLPVRERFTNSVALLPLGQNEQHGELRIHDSMYEPTRQRRRAFHEAGGTRAKLLKNAARCVTEWGAYSTTLTADRPAETFVSYFTPPEDIFFTTRPLIFMTDWLANMGEITVGRLAAHETVHALQGERDSAAVLSAAEASPSQGQLYMADSEFEAYNTGAVILGLAGYDVTTSDKLDCRVARLASIQYDRVAFVNAMMDLGVVEPILNQAQHWSSLHTSGS